MGFTQEDERFMRRALLLARRGLGAVEPNPVVGAVVVKGGQVLGEGYHHHFGGPHAEVFALEAAGSKARGATLYVTLEPCCHWGKTPPCTDAVRAAGISRVVTAIIDPFARVRGKGARLLRRAGIPVDVGLLEAEARRVNGAFLTRLAHRRPWIIAKWAQSLDGSIATASGESKWISGAESREVVQRLRGRVDGILVGIGTVLADDPLLTARPSRPRDVRRIATRIVLDSQCRLPIDGQFMRTVGSAPVLVVHAQKLSRTAEQRRQRLANSGAMVLAVGANNGRLDLSALLRHLADQDYANLLVEGGAQVIGTLIDAELIDEFHLFQAPQLIPGGRRALGGAPLKTLAAAPQLEITAVDRLGPDLHLTGYALRTKAAVAMSAKMPKCPRA